jgi:hypothetical protein
VNASEILAASEKALEFYGQNELALMGIDPANPNKLVDTPRGKAHGGGGASGNGADKAIATRKSRYGETKLKKKTVRDMERDGDHVKKHANERRGKRKRTN